MMSICLVTFAVICVGLVVFIATLGTAETADFAGGRGGFLFGRKRDTTVLHTIHKQVGNQATNFLFSFLSFVHFSTCIPHASNRMNPVKCLCIFPSLSPHGSLLKSFVPFGGMCQMCTNFWLALSIVSYIHAYVHTYMHAYIYTCA
jgi:hypothetical protein